MSNTTVNLGVDPDDMAQDAALVAHQFLSERTWGEIQVPDAELDRLEQEAKKLAIKALKNDFRDHLRRAAVRRSHAEQMPVIYLTSISQQQVCEAQELLAVVIQASDHKLTYRNIAKAAVGLVGETWATDIAEAAGTTCSEVSTWRSHLRLTMDDLMKKK